MAIKNWHFGKIVLCWVAGLLMMFLALPIGVAMERSRGLYSVPSLLVLIFLVGLPIFLFVVTWKWLSGREKTGPPASQ